MRLKAHNVLWMMVLLLAATPAFADLNLNLKEVMNNAVLAWQIKAENNTHSAAYADLQERLQLAQRSKTNLIFNAQDLQNFASAPDYNTLVNAQLIHSFSTPFIWGSNVSTGVGATYTRQFQPSVSDRLAPYLSLSYKQPLSPKAIAYAEQKNSYSNTELARLKEQQDRDQFLRQIVHQYYSVYRSNQQYDIANVDEQLDELQDNANAVSASSASIQALVTQADRLVQLARLQRQRSSVNSQTENFLKKVGISADVDDNPVIFSTLPILANVTLTPPEQLPPETQSLSAILDQQEMARRQIQLLAPDASNSPQLSVSAYVSDEDIIHSYGGATANILAGPAGTFKAAVTFPLFNDEDYQLALRKNQMDLDAYKASMAEKQAGRQNYLAFLYEQAMDADATVTLINTRIQLIQKAVASAANQQGTDSTAYQQTSQKLNYLTTVELVNAQVARNEAYANYLMETQGVEAFLKLIGITL